jgi:endonuclease/exonuclease/phosphatase (EEP) superfamily protein YafD
VLVACVALAGCLPISLARLLGSDHQRLVLAASFAPWAVIGYTVAVLAALLGWWGAHGQTSTTPRRLMAVGLAVSVTGLVLGLHLSWLFPAFVGEHAARDPDLTVLALNMHYGEADIGTTARLTTREQPDVVVLTEATPVAVQALAQQGVGGPDSRWPHRGGEPHPGAAGTVVLSAHPVAEDRPLDILTGAHRMRIGGPRPFWLTALHTTQPLKSAPRWRHDFGVLVADARTVTGPRLAVGDFNATLDHGPMHDLMATGLRSAAEEANSGWQPTWPTAGSRTMGGVPVPFRLLAIDHVLLSRQLSAVSTEVASVPGTDHHAVIARVGFRDAR